MSADTSSGTLRPRSFLDSIPVVGRDRVLAATSTRRLRPREVVVRQGEPAEGLYLV